MILRGAALLCVLAVGFSAPLAAQQVTQSVTAAPGGILRWLDKTTGETADIELERGQAAVSGRLTIQLDECRYPTANPASDAFAHLTIMEQGAASPVFSGWMIASSPAISALEHPRYDVWVLRCLTPDQPQLQIIPDTPPVTNEEDLPQEG